MSPQPAAETPSRDAPVRWRTILAYTAIFALVFAGLGSRIRLHYDGSEPQSKMSPAELRILWYRRHFAEVDLVFVGDSRTYTGIDPYCIDAALGTRSANLATFAHWFPTQYPSFQDLTEIVPPTTVVVWSIGYQNFRFTHKEQNRAHPIRVRNVPRYLLWGYSWSAIADNVVDELYRDTPGLGLLSYRETLRASFDQWVAKPIVARSVASGTGAPRPLRNEAAYRDIEARWFQDPRVFQVRPMIDGDEITSAEIATRMGNYIRVEIDPDFFRAKQRELGALVGPVTPGTLSAEPALWNTFIGTLDLFRSRGVHLVVNEVEEAPYNYRFPGNREALQGFMSKVRAAVEEHGFPYIRADWERLSDADYFDYNHLNETGVHKYCEMLPPLLQAYAPAKTSSWPSTR